MKPIQIGDVVGDYKVIDIAGSGGMGAVYKIEHVITQRIEAMKLLPPGSSSDHEQVQRFEREIQVQARLHHPNIVALYNAIRDGSTIALVMEFVEGESLQRKLQNGPLPVETAVDFAAQVLSALAYAHDAGVIHRDVGPANIIITPERIAKLTDFGLARGATDLRLSTSGVPVGSPWYMSPEQVKGVSVLDARTDLYAMGAVLHEMLTGAKLFEAEGAFAVMRAHVEADPAPPSSRNPAVPAALDEIVRKAVEKDPALRFQSAEEFRRALLNEVPVERPMAVSAGHWRAGRAAILMALAPAALIAGIYTVRYFPGRGRAHATESQARPAAISRSEVVAPPVAAVQVAPEVPGMVPAAPLAAPVEVPVEAERPVVIVRHRAPSHTPPTRQAGKQEPSYAIRVTGGEPTQPVAAMPAPSLFPRASADVPEPPVTHTDSVTTPPAESISVPPELAATSEPAAAKPQAGNRFVRALGKVNPFRKSTKHDAPDAAKTQLNKN